MAEIPGQAQSPLNAEDREARRSGWRDFLLGLRDTFNDPVKGQVLMALGGALAQDRQPGQSQTDFVSRAMQTGAAAGGRAEQGLRDQAVQAGKERREEEELDIRREGVEVQREGIRSREEIARGREAGATARHRESQQTTRELAEIEARQRDRQFQAQMARLTAQMESEKQRHLETMQRLDTTHEERMAAAKRLEELQKQENLIRMAGTEGPNKLKLVETAIEMSTETDPLGNAKVDPVRMQNNLALLNEMVGGGINVERTADVQRAAQAARKVLQDMPNASYEERAQKLRESAQTFGYGEETAEAAIRFLPQDTEQEGRPAGQAPKRGGGESREDAQERNRLTPLAMNVLSEISDLRMGAMFGRVPDPETAKTLLGRAERLLKNRSLSDDMRQDLEAAVNQQLRGWAARRGQ